MLLMRACLLSACLCLTGCSDPDGARKALDDAGFSEIEITGGRWFGCGRDDTSATGFRARNPRGKSVTGTVCSSWFKGATIRFD